MEKSGPIPDAPPSYDASMAGPPGVAAGGFQAPPPMHDPKGAMPGAVPPAQAYVAPQQQYGVPPPPQQQYGAPQQYGGPVPVNAPPGTVIIVNQPNYGPNPIDMVCPHCQSQIRTATDSEPGPLAWILAGVLCVVGLWPCACIPCCIDSLNAVTHKCPSCKKFLGRYKGGM